METSQIPLLSADTCQRQDLNHIDPKHVIHSVNTQNHPDTVTPKTAEEIVSTYEDVFDGLGCLKGELHLEIDHKVRPVQQLLRRTPIPIKERVTTAIREMEQKGITAKVTEPTPWISNMVVTEKKDKLRNMPGPGSDEQGPIEITLPDAHSRRNTAGISKGQDILSIRCKRWLLASATG